MASATTISIKDDRTSEIKLFLQDVPQELEEFIRWKSKSRVAFCNCTMAPVAAEKLLLRAERPEITLLDLEIEEAHPFKRHDVKLYQCISMALKGTWTIKFSTKIEQHCWGMHGRQAWRTLIKAVEMNAARLAMNASAEMGRIKCKNILNLADFATRFQTLRDRNPALDAATTIEHLRRAVKGVPEAQPVMDMFTLGVQDPNTIEISDILDELSALSTAQRFDI